MSVKSNKSINCTGDVIHEGGDPETGTIFGPKNGGENTTKDNGGTQEKVNDTSKHTKEPKRQKSNQIIWRLTGFGQKVMDTLNNVDEKVGKLFDDQEEEDGQGLL